ncbi:hypothetical protein Hanom_Chr04g00366571 [Helianthus anomalus]
MGPPSYRSEARVACMAFEMIEKQELRWRRSCRLFFPFLSAPFPYLFISFFSGYAIVVVISWFGGGALTGSEMVYILVWWWWPEMMVVNGCCWRWR